MTLKSEVRRAVEEFVQEAKRKANGSIERMVLFGSQARGDARADSDIDILVVWRGGEVDGWDAMVGAAVNVMHRNGGGYISVKVFTPAEVARMKKMGSPFIENVEREGIDLG